MRCYACDTIVIPSEAFDAKTGRYYCPCCNEAIQDTIEEMSRPDSGLELPLEELPSDETYRDYNLPVEDYYES